MTPDEINKEATKEAAKELALQTLATAVALEKITEERFRLIKRWNYSLLAFNFITSVAMVVQSTSFILFVQSFNHR